MSDVHYVIHKDHIAVFVDGDYYELENEPDIREKVVSAAESGDGEVIEKLVGLVADEETRTVLEDERFELGPQGLVYLKGTDVPMPQLLGEKILSFVEQDLPVEPMVNFWKYCILNPSPNSRDMLFDFLQNHNLPVTKEGYFIAYKRVGLADHWAEGEGGEPEVVGKQVRDEFGTIGQPYVTEDVRIDPDTGERVVEEIDLTDRLKLVDLYTGKMNNSIGEIVAMDRQEVVEDPRKTCAAGLHVASMEYIPHYGAGSAAIRSPEGKDWSDLTVKQRRDHLQDQSSDPIVKVLVNPADVVSVPEGHERAKMRVCRYYVMSLFNGQHEEDYNPARYITNRAAQLRAQLDEQIEEQREKMRQTEAQKEMIPG
jgi:hypothetical protein